MKVHLTVPSIASIHELMAWFPDEPSARVWGGPLLRFPLVEECFLQDIHWGRMATYVLEDEGHAMLGFGQLYQKEGRAHLARIAVSPAKRGAGLGRLLVAQLIDKGRELFPGADNSLYVMRTNERALRCYLSLGFVEMESPKADKTYPDQVFMVRKQASTPADSGGSQ